MDTLQALFIILSDSDQTERVLEILLKCGMRGATIVETMGMGKVLAENMPIFGSLRALLPERHESSQTIFTVSKYPEKVDKAMEMISSEFNEFKEPCSGMMFVMPVVKAVGFGQKQWFEE